MNRKRFLGICLIFLTVAFIFIQPAYAGPGGQIAKLIARTFWGKMVLGLLTLNLLPIGIYLYIKQKLAERRAHKGLRQIARDDPNFAWSWARGRIIDCLYRVYTVWNEEDVVGACDYMTDWFWQNRQLVYLDRWHREDLRNICEVKEIRSVRPLLFIHRSEGALREGSVLVVSIKVNLQDYLVRRETGTIVEGDRKFRDRETVWTFAFVQSQWRVSNIEEAGCEFDYIFQAKNVPGEKETRPGRIDQIMTGSQQIHGIGRTTGATAPR